jgi:hypothetical protein
MASSWRSLSLILIAFWPIVYRDWFGTQIVIINVVALGQSHFISGYFYRTVFTWRYWLSYQSDYQFLCLFSIRVLTVPYSRMMSFIFTILDQDAQDDRNTKLYQFYNFK